MNRSEWVSRARRALMPVAGGVLLIPGAAWAQASVTLDEAEVRSWRMPVGDEPYQGIWAKRYWTDDARVKSQAPSLFDSDNK